MFQKRVTTRKFGEILVGSDVITEDELRIALKRQEENGQPLGKNLIELGYIDADKITQCLAEQYNMPFISLDRCNITNDLMHLISEPIAQRYGVVPVDLIGDILTVGIMDVPDEKIVKRIQKATGFRIQVMLITPSDFEQHTRKAREISFMNGSNAAEPAADRFIKMPAYEGMERRRFKRFHKQVKVKYEFRNEYNVHISVNLSQCGALIKSKTPVPVNSHIVIKMELPTSYEDVIIISKVVRVEMADDCDSYLVALNFDSMDASDSNRLSEFMKVLDS